MIKESSISQTTCTHLEAIDVQKLIPKRSLTVLHISNNSHPITLLFMVVMNL